MIAVWTVIVDLSAGFCSSEGVCDTSNYWLIFVRCVGPWLTELTVGNRHFSWRHSWLVDQTTSGYIYRVRLTCVMLLALSHLLAQPRWPSLYAVWRLLAVVHLCWCSLLGSCRCELPVMLSLFSPVLLGRLGTALWLHLPSLCSDLLLFIMLAFQTL